MLFIRFQGTSKKETNSYYIDLQRIYEDSEYLSKEKLYKEWEFNLKLRNNIGPEDLLNKVIYCNSMEEVHLLCHKYKLSGVFSYNAEYIMYVNDLKTIDELINFMKLNRAYFIGDSNCRDRMVQSCRYLIVFEGNLIYDFGADGCLVEMNSITRVVEFEED